MKFWKFVKVATLILFIVLISAVIFIFYVFHDFSLFDCHNRIINEVKSPDSSYKVVVFDRSCGTTAGYSTQVSIMSISDLALPNQPGNTLIFNGYNVPVSVVWISGDKVSISSSDAKATYAVKTIKNKVTIHLAQ